MSFGEQLRRFRENTMTRYEEVKRESCFDLFSSIILDTPVDKGVLRNNWYMSFGTPTELTNDVEDINPTGVIQRLKTGLDDVTLGKDVWFVNNLPYASRIEFDGYSGKAPQGMVRVNTVRWDMIVERNARRAGRRKDK